MKLPDNIRKKISDLGIDPNLDQYELLRELNDKELEIGYTDDWEMTAVGREVERLYDAVYRLEEEPGEH